MPKTVTFTANLLAETTYEYAAWQEGKTVRAQGESFQVGGKGINVSKMLDKLGAENVALCFPGGPFGPMTQEWLTQAGISLMAFETGCVTRTGSVVRAPGQKETTFLGVDSVVSEEAVREAVGFLQDIGEPFVFAVCGSVQNWSDPCWEPLREWIATRGDSVSLVVDNYGPSLTWFAQRQPELIKINRDELELLFPESEKSRPTGDLLKAARQRHDCPYWVVTNGGEPIWVMEGEKEPESFRPPEVELVSPTGCGDIVFATLIDCLFNRSGQYDLLRGAKLAAEYASRSAAMPGIAEFEL